MSTQVNVKISRGLSLTASATMILVGALLVKGGVLESTLSIFVFVLGVLLAIAGTTGILNLVKNRSKNFKGLLIAIGVLILGILVFVFSDQISQYVLAGIGLLLAIYAVLDLVNGIKDKGVVRVILIIVAIIKIAVGIIIFLTAFGQAIKLTNTIIDVFGWVSIGVGSVLLLLGK